MESYSRGRRGVPAKDVGVERRARVQIPHSPPEVNCTHPREKLWGCVFFFLYESFGMVIPFTAPKPDSSHYTNWKFQKRDDYGNFC